MDRPHDNSIEPWAEIHNPYRSGLAVPHLDQYFGLWCVQEERFRASVDRVNRLDLHLHIAQYQPAAARSGESQYRVTAAGTAVIPLTGPLTKYDSSLGLGASTIRLRQQVRDAARREDVPAILLLIDSPGGTVAGTRDLAGDVQAAARSKPVMAYIEDLGASAAYWIASQATKVYANPTALVGSIGTYAVVVDSSAWAAKEGFRVHVLKAGQFKGAGEEGTQITPEQLVEWQRVVNELNEFFVHGVAAGRGLSLDQARQLADGRIHIGQAAVELGLIDGVQSLDQTLAQLTPQSRSKRPMSEPTQEAAPPLATPAAASYHQLKTGCPGADAEFLCRQLEAGATLDQARDAWMAEQNRRIETAHREAEEARAKTARPGVVPLGSGQARADEEAADPIAAWNALIEKYVRQGMKRGKATSHAVRHHPEEHRAYLVAYNLAHGRSEAAGRLHVGR